MADDPKDHDARVDSNEQPFLEHIIELRARLLRSVLLVVVLFFPIYYFANDIYTFVAAPLLANLPGGTMIATGVATPFLTPFKLAIYTAVFLSVPFILHQAWAFVAPGLYLHEKKLAAPLLASSVGLFYLGVLFAYFVVFPLMFQFLAGVSPEGVTMMTDIGQYLDFVMALFLAFGAAFEIPIATFLLVWTGFATTDSLIAKRPYVIVGCFVAGMLLTPPDVLSQVLLAIPMWMLYEAGIFFARFVRRRADAAQREATEQEDGTT
ncbi:MAG: twin-arginine translocase subunit TatC [Pseudomonadales bacterium]|nr:twin-arginine translocase subunit TatC [Pseudomonadales bacterium]